MSYHYTSTTPTALLFTELLFKALSFTVLLFKVTTSMRCYSNHISTYEEASL